MAWWLKESHNVKTLIFQDTYIITADAEIPCITRSSIPGVLIMQGNQVLAETNAYFLQF